MNNIFENYKVISLGYDCYVKMKFCPNQETHFFDYIGSSMWSINELLKNKFEDVLNFDYFENLEITKDTFYITNKKYYIRFPHDFKSITQIGKVKRITMKITEEIKKKFIDKYTRRISRFYDLLTGNEKLLFIRKEEHTNRISYPEYNEHIKYTEIYYIREFINILKKDYPNLNFKIIFFSFSQETSKEDNLLILQTDLYNDTKFNELINRTGFFTT